ncbi:MAG TPA: carboxypeptidase regulatory-like domain-containing protein [Terracidiphilus sp.]|nr:carboxypeptidase regulatory-like domain-containing protein [Terracidiphilus sp.]
MKHPVYWLSQVSARIVSVAGILSISALLFFSSPRAFAQNDVGTIVGFVTDQTGAVVPDATVTIVNEGTGETRTVTTDAAGHFAVPNLPPAIYTMTAEAKGFQKFVSSHNTLASNTTVQISAKLAVGEASQTVQVSDTADVLQTQSAAIQSEVNGTQIQKEELNGRNPLYMAQLLPGVVSTTTMADLNFGFNSGDSFEVNGARQNDTKYTIDGAMASRTRGDSQIIAGANVDSVQEMQVLTGDYSAEYGSASGAQIRVITKSGTRDFHGALYEYVRNADLNANTWSLNHADQPRQQFTYNNFGFAVGGPVWAPKVPALDKWRDKFFFFVNEDWVIFHQSIQQLMAVPTARMRTGDFSELLSSNPWYKTGTVVIDPATGQQADYNGQPNVLPPGELSANGLAIMSTYPSPTPGFLQGTDNWSGTADQPQNQRKGQVNGDLILGNHHLEFRRSDDSYTETAPYNQSNPDVPLSWSRPNQDNSLGWVWTITPTMVNEAHTSMSIDDVYINVDPVGIGYNRSNFGINFPYIIPGPKASEQKIPTANLNDSFSSIQGGPYPSHSSGIIYQDSDSLTKVWKNHTFKGGFFLTYWGENDNDQINVSTVPGGASNQNGTFTLSDNHGGLPGGSGVSLANLALGLADSYTEIGTKAFTMWRGWVFEYFGQDSWQVTPKLNVSYGVRITSTIPEHAMWGNADYFDPASYSASSAPTVNPTTGNITLGTGNAYDGIVIPGFSSFPGSAVQHGVAAATASNNLCAGAPCNSLFAPNLPKQYIASTTQPQPRLGFAYQLYPTMVVRAGVGSFVSTKGLLDNVFPGGNSPFQPTETTSSSGSTDLVDNPGVTVTTGVEPALTITSLNRHLVPPTRWNWNLTIEQEIPQAQSVFQIAYVGAHGYHNWDVVDINQVPAGTLQANPGINVNYLRPYKGLTSIQQEQSGVSSNYNALQVSWNSRFRGGSLIGVSYTWSQSRDQSSNYRDIVPDSYNMSNLWGPSEYDIPQAFTLNYLWAEPFFANKHNLLGEVAGGWQLAGNVQAQKGEPCGIGASTDYAGVSSLDLGSFGCGSEGQFWVKNGNPQHLGHFAGYAPSGENCSNTPSLCYFTTSVFSKPTAGTFNLQKGVRDDIRQTGIENWNLSMIKSFPMTESTGFEFRAEAYNFINHPNWSNPQLNPTSGSFGEVTGKNGNNRNLQLGLRFHF